LRIFSTVTFGVGLLPCIFSSSPPFYFKASNGRFQQQNDGHASRRRAGEYPHSSIVIHLMQYMLTQCAALRQASLPSWRQMSWPTSRRPVETATMPPPAICCGAPGSRCTFTTSSPGLYGVLRQHSNTAHSSWHCAPSATYLSSDWSRHLRACVTRDRICAGNAGSFAARCIIAVVAALPVAPAAGSPQIALVAACRNVAAAKVGHT
jgi:hypothetical protein